MGTNTLLTYENDSLEIDVGDITYTVDVSVKANYWYQAGRMYMSNGDPGYPEESELEIEEIDAVWHDIAEDGSDKIVEPTEEMTQELENYLYDMDWDNWDNPSDYEPEPDDYDDYDRYDYGPYTLD